MLKVTRSFTVETEYDGEFTLSEEEAVTLHLALNKWLGEVADPNAIKQERKVVKAGDSEPDRSCVLRDEEGDTLKYSAKLDGWSWETVDGQPNYSAYGYGWDYFNYQDYEVIN